MKLENFLTNLFLYGGIIIALVLLFWNSIMNFIFNWIEPHPDKELYLKYEKLGRRIGKARTEKQIEALTIELHEFEINNKHTYQGSYYSEQLKRMIRGKQLKLSVDREGNIVYSVRQ